jgi:hypothetical protein
MRRLGRPGRDAETLAKDDAIGRTVNQLMFWGFSEVKILGLVARGAATLLLRTDTYGKPLSEDRIEQIYKHWRKTQTTHFKPRRARYTKKSLSKRIPEQDAPLDERVAKLLSHSGYWPESTGETFVPYFDPDLTPKAHAEYLKNYIPIKTG